MATPPGISELEFYTGIVVGEDPDVPPLPPATRPYEAALGDLLRPHLASGRCFIWFTGDLGSSLVLHAAVNQARAESLPLPIPVSLIFGDSHTPEEARQEQIVRTLAVPDWPRVTVGEDLSFLGAHSRRSLDQLGVGFPSVAHLIAPLADIAQGGALFDLHGVEEAWLFWRGGHLASVVSGHRLRRRDVGALVALGPAGLRRRFANHAADKMPFRHLRPELRSAARRHVAEISVQSPLTFTGASRHLYRRRCGRLTVDRFRSIAASAGAEVIMPFLVPEIAASLLRLMAQRRWLRPRDMVADQWPEFPPPLRGQPGIPWGAFWGAPAVSDFIERWDGSGLDPAVVDPDGLRQAWREGDATTSMLLQAAWLAERQRTGDSVSSAASA